MFPCVNISLINSHPVRGWEHQRIFWPGFSSEITFEAQVLLAKILERAKYWWCAMYTIPSFDFQPSLVAETESWLNEPSYLWYWPNCSGRKAWTRKYRNSALLSYRQARRNTRKWMLRPWNERVTSERPSWGWAFLWNCWPHAPSYESVKTSQWLMITRK